MTTTLVLERGSSEEAFRSWAVDQRLEQLANEPTERGLRYLVFGDGGRFATWIARAGSAFPLLVLEGEGNDSLVESAIDRFRVEPLDDLLGRISAAQSPASRLHALSDVAVLCDLRASNERVRGVEAVGAELLSQVPCVRYLAAEIIGAVPDARALALLEAAVGHHEDLAPARDRMAELLAWEADGTLRDGPTDDWYELERRAEQGIQQGQWKRVEKAADDLLAQDPDHVRGLHYRGRAYEASGEVLLALCFLGAAHEVLAHELGQAESDDEDDEDAESLDDDDDEERARDRTALEEVAARIETLRGRAREFTMESVAAPRDLLVARLSDSRKHNSWLATGAAKALAGIDPGLEALLLYLLGANEGDVGLLEQVVRLAADSAWAEFALGRACRKTSGTAARNAFERALRMVRADSPGTSSEAELIQRFEGRPLDLPSILEALAEVCLEIDDRQRALELANELVTLNPDSQPGWQIRAHALLFEHRYEEAAEAYAEAITELTRIREAAEERGSMWFGTDARPRLHMNRACAFGRLGKQAETLECLRHAVRLNEALAEEAKTEDWLQCVWGTPEFEAITRREESALVTEEDLTEEAVTLLIQKCRTAELGEAVAAGARAVEFARLRGDARQEVEALCEYARAVSFAGEAARGVALAEESTVLAREQALAVRALAASTRAVVLDLSGDPTAAEAAYLEGLELRRQAHGDDHPILAKSLGDLARLRLGQGRIGDEVMEPMLRGIAILERFLAVHVTPDASWIDAMVDKATLEVNLARAFGSQERWSEAMSSLESAADTLRDVSQHTGLRRALVEGAHALAELISGLEGIDTGRAGTLVERLEALRFPGSPAERVERKYFASLRAFVEGVRGQGVDDATIAGVLREAVRGLDGLAPELRTTPVLANMSVEFAARYARYPTSMVMAAMAFDLMAQDLDGTLTQLEELCVGYAAEG
jgi:tetratricopeptide (TPR) repeat protein